MITLSSQIGDITPDSHVITKLEFDLASKLGLDASMVREDSEGTGTVMVFTNLKRVKEYCGKWKSWSPSFMKIGVKTNGKECSVNVSGSGYNEDGLGKKASAKGSM